MMSYIYDIVRHEQSEIYKACIFIFPMRYVRFENETINKTCVYSIILGFNPDIAFSLLFNEYNKIINKMKNKGLIE
jgi:hypothetical protein